MKEVGTLLRKITSALSVISGWMILVGGMIVVIDLVGRNFFNTPLPGSVAFGEYALIAIVFLAIPYAQRKDQHVSFELLVSSLRPKTAAALSALGLFLVLIPVTYIAIGSIDLAWTSYQSGKTILGIVSLPEWPLRVMIALGISMLVPEMTRTILKYVREWRLTRDKHSELGASILVDEKRV